MGRDPLAAPRGHATTSLCRHMVCLADAEAAWRWLGDDPDSAALFTPAESVEFAARFFGPLVDRDDGRR